MSSNSQGRYQKKDLRGGRVRRGQRSRLVPIAFREGGHFLEKNRYKSKVSKLGW